MIRGLASILVLVILTASNCLIAQTVDSSYSTIVSSFFAKIDSAKYDEAVAYIYSSNRWVDAESDAIVKVRRGLADLPSMAGKLLNHEQLTEAAIGSSFIHLDYIVNFEREPFRFYFDFHKVGDNWIIDDFGFKDDLAAWASDKAKNIYLYSASRK